MTDQTIIDDVKESYLLKLNHCIEWLDNQFKDKHDEEDKYSRDFLIDLRDARAKASVVGDDREALYKKLRLQGDEITALKIKCTALETEIVNLKGVV